MDKWDYIRYISDYGHVTNTDTILKLLEWCNKPSTQSVSEQEAQEFWIQLQK